MMQLSSMNTESVTRYIEICSAYRDRQRYPNPSTFQVEISSLGSGNTAFKSRDPMFRSVVVYPPPNMDRPIAYNNFGYMYSPWLNIHNPGNPGDTLSDTVLALLPTIKSTNQAISSLSLSTARNAYVGNTLERIATGEYRTIIDYQIITNGTSVGGTVDTATYPVAVNDISITPAFAFDNLISDTATIEFTLTTDPLLAGTKRNITLYRAYDSRVFFDEPVDATITGGDSFIIRIPQYQVVIDKPFTTAPIPIGTIVSGATDPEPFRIRKSYPLVSGTLTGGTTTTFTLPVAVGATNFTGGELWITSNPIVFSGVVSVAAANSFTTVGANFPDGFLNNMQITTDDGYSSTIHNWDFATQTGIVSPQWDAVGGFPVGPNLSITQKVPNEYRLITAYNPSTRVGSVQTAFSYLNTYGVSTTYAVGNTDTFNILQFERDNYCQLDYAESMVLSQQAACYELGLISLSLPNAPLKNTIGGKIQYYPYVYVEFSSLTQGTSAYDFNTNNPNANRAMFRAPIFLNNLNLDARFVNVDGHGMVQTLKFSPNDSFHFSVYLPDGTPFLTEDDYFSPSCSNPYLQISACFSVKRM